MNIDKATSGRDTPHLKTGVSLKLAIVLLILFTLPMAPVLEAQNFDDINDAIAQGQYGNLNAVIVSRHGEIIFE